MCYVDGPMIGLVLRENDMLPGEYTYDCRAETWHNDPARRHKRNP